MEIRIYLQTPPSGNAKLTFLPPLVRTGDLISETAVILPDGWTYQTFGNDGVVMSRDQRPVLLNARQVLTYAQACSRGFRLKEAPVNSSP